MEDDKKYIQDSSDNVYKVLPTHFLKLSPWQDGEDRRVHEKDVNGYKYISYKNACMIVNNQFADTTETWEHHGKKYIASSIPSDKNIDEHTYILKQLPDHKSIIRDSNKIINKLPDNSPLTISSEDGKSELKMVKIKGKVYYILIINEFLPRVKCYSLFGEFVQWVGIKNCKPIFCETDKTYI